MLRLRSFFLFVLLLGPSSSASFAQSAWTEEAGSRGVSYVTPYANWDPQGYGYGCGLGLNDLDNDGDPDLVLLGRGDGQVSVFENDGVGYFGDRTSGSGLPANEYLSGVSAADYDGDGDLDLYLSGWLVPNRLYRNDGGFVFTDVTAAAGVGDSGPASGSCWGDYDGDGWLDLYVTNRSGPAPGEIPNRLYRNLGNGSFLDVAATFGVDALEFSFQASWFDHDRDGDLDLYLSNDKGSQAQMRHNRLWRNDNGVLVEISAAAGVDLAIDSMGLAVGDLDGNGYFDLYCTNTPSGNKLLMNQGNGTYVEQALAAGAAIFASGWGTTFFDYNNDSNLDLFVANSILGNRLLRNPGSFPLVDATTPANLGALGNSFGVAAGDIDGDGDLDLVVQTYLEPIAIYVNPESSSRSWLKVKLNGLSPNTLGVGATVELTIAGQAQVRQVMAGTSFKCSEPALLHFGLGASGQADQVVVRWPSGLASVLTGVSGNQRVVFDEATAFEDCNQNMIADDVDLLNGGADADANGILDACDVSFIRGDGDGDAAVNLTDVIALLQYVFSSGAGSCLDAMDTNDDGAVNVVDAINLLGYLFSMGATPADPFPACGVDPGADLGVPLDCQVSSCP